MSAYSVIARTTLCFAAVLALAFSGCATTGAHDDNGNGGGQTGVILAEGLPELAAVALAADTVYFAGRSDGSSWVWSIPLAGGAVAAVAGGLGEVPDIAASGAACVFADTQALLLYRGRAGEEPEVLNRGREAGAKWLAADEANVYWIDTTGALLVSLNLPILGDPSDPPPPLSFPVVIANTSDGSLLELGGGHLYCADEGATALARFGLSSGTREVLSRDIGVIRGIAATASEHAAVGTNGVWRNGRRVSSETGAVALAFAGSTLVYATPSAVYTQSGAEGPELLVRADGLVALDASADAAVIAENAAGGGRLRRLTLGGPSGT